MQKTLEYIESHQDQHIRDLSEFLAIPSVSTDAEYKADVERCAAWLSEHLAQCGLENVQQIPSGGHPAVYADWLHAGSNAPTVLFYGHYDVQPVDPLDLWTSPPFEPIVKDGKIYARGAVDDKGQVMLQIKALEACLRSDGRLPVNVKLLIEGEEEIGSEHLEDILREHRERLACDVILISDTAMFGPAMPSLVYGLRGLTYMEITVHGPNRDLHSGSFGGAVDNPANALCAMIAQLKDAFGRIQIPGFYDSVRSVSETERRELQRLPWDEQGYADSLGLAHTNGEFGYSTLERLWARPTLDVNGIWGGFTGEGAKTVLPAKASAKISMRLVPDQDCHDIAEKFEQYIRTIAPPTVRVEVQSLHGGNPALTEIDSVGMRAAMRALELAYGRKPFLQREGGSIPIVLVLQEILAADTVLMGFGLNTENTHSPNEHFSLANYKSGSIATAHFYHELLNLSAGSA